MYKKWILIAYGDESEEFLLTLNPNYYDLATPNYLSKGTEVLDFDRAEGVLKFFMDKLQANYESTNNYYMTVSFDESNKMSREFINLLKSICKVDWNRYLFYTNPNA